MDKTEGAKNWWTQEQEDILRAQYPSCQHVSSLVSVLGHSVNSIFLHAIRMGLKRNWKHRRITDPNTGQVTKYCMRCERMLPIEAFYEKSSLCKPCNNEYGREYRAANIDRIKQQGKDRYKRDKVRRKYLKIKQQYGLTPEQYDSMYAAQGGKCAICGRHQSTLTKGLAVDHDHESGKVRSLLCGLCNTALGNMNDDPGLLRKAADYLEEHRCYLP